MTGGSGNRMDVEQELTARLTALARAFIADLNAQGRLVETGGAEALRRLRQQNGAQDPRPEAETGDGEVTEAAVHPAPDVPVRWEAIARPRTGEDPPATLEPSHPLHLLYASGSPRASASTPGSYDAPAGAPAPDPAEQTPAVAPADGQDTGVQEPQAAHGDEAQSPAAATAARLRAESAGRLEVTQITSDDERVTVHIHALSLNDWEYWLTAIGAPWNAPTHRTGWAQTAVGHLAGVEVRLIADAVPRLLQEAAQRAAEPFCLGGRVYDLALSHTDRHGQTWHYHGQRQEDDIPLLTLDGPGGPSYPLTSIVTANGPLTPATAAAANPDDRNTR